MSRPDDSAEPAVHYLLPMPSAISVIVVSDYGSTSTRSWNDERACLDALAAQDFDEPVEVILSEDERFRASVPADVAERPDLRLVFTAAPTSYALKNAGVRAASAPLVALIDADCRADPDWLRHLVAALRSRPDISVVSGRTFYDGNGLGERVLCLLTRSYLDPGRPGETKFASNNAVGFRKDVFLAHPLPERLGPFAARIQSESIRRAGGVLWFEPRMRVVHEFEGWRMEADIRKHIGYGTVATRLAEPWMPYASLVRFGVVATPVITAGKLLNTWRDCVRCRRAYGVRWFEMPFALATAIAVHGMEVPGMLAAYSGRDLGSSAYR
jgi:hypothetical protein